MHRKKFILSLPLAMMQLKSLAKEKGQNMLIVYYSWSGNTRQIADFIKKHTAGDILEIIPEKAYSSVYKEVVDQAKIEIAKKHQPAIKTKIPNLANYHTIFIGSPNWWGTIASPMRTFLAENDLSGKKIFPFMTHEGSRMGNANADIKKLCPNSEILTALPIRGGAAKNADKEVLNWISSNKIIA